MARTLQALADVPVTQLKGVGEARAASLAKLELHTVLDLLTYYPRRYLDRTNERRIDELDVGEEAMVLVKVKAVHAMRTRSRKAMVTARRDRRVGLPEGHVLQPAVARAPAASRAPQAVLFGKVDLFRGRRQMTNPVVDLVGDKTGRIVPVYPQSEKAGIMTWDVDRWMTEVLDRAGEFADPVPAEVLRPVVAGRAHDRRSTTSTSPRRWPRRWTPGGGWCSTSCSGCSCGWCSASGSSSATTPGIVHDIGGVARAPVPRTAAVPADRRAAAGHRRDRPATWPARIRCTGCCRATSARARRSWR